MATQACGRSRRRGTVRPVTLVHRVLPPEPYASLDEYLARGGGVGLANARQVAPVAIIDEIEASGLRGRGGAGFPTGVKWRTVASYASPEVRTTVVVNAAEGEPSTYKDRTIIQRNPYEVIEGALIAAIAIGATHIIIATKELFTAERARLGVAVEQFRAEGLVGDVQIEIVTGPDEYLFGEETGLLEVIDGRPPFPRIAPPYRRGVDEVVEDDEDATSGSGLSAHVEMAAPGDEFLAPPALVDNVETMANIPRIIGRGAAWFRTEGTDASPGTIVCTVSGAVRRAGVAEVMLGTTVREAIEEVGGGLAPGVDIKVVMTGVSTRRLDAGAARHPDDLRGHGGDRGGPGHRHAARRRQRHERHGARRRRGAVPRRRVVRSMHPVQDRRADDRQRAGEDVLR